MGNIVATQNEFVNYLLELLAPFGHITSRAMFGGHGIYKDGLIFAIVIDDGFYLKVDEGNRREFEARELAPFLYQSKSKNMQVSLSYYACPEEALENWREMMAWAKSGYGAALRAAAKKQPKKVTNAVVRPASRAKRPASHKKS